MTAGSVVSEKRATFLGSAGLGWRATNSGAAVGVVIDGVLLTPSMTSLNCILSMATERGAGFLSEDSDAE